MFSNNGNGTFQLTDTLKVIGGGGAVVTGDFNGDGFPDVAVGNGDSSTVTVFLNDGHGKFSQSSLVKLTGYAGSIVVGDFNGTGVLNMAVTMPSALCILFNRQHSAQISLSTTAATFGAVFGGSTKSIYLRFSNEGGDSTLQVSSILSSNTSFAIDRTSLSVPPGMADSVRITFSPTGGLAYLDSLTITSNDPLLPLLEVCLMGFAPLRSTSTAFRTTLKGPIYAGPSMLGSNILYTVASGDAVYRMNAKGDVIYNLQVGGTVRSSSSIAYDTTVYIASSDRNLYCFSKFGTSTWPALPLGGELSATPVVDSISNLLYIGVSNKNFVAVSRSAGTVVWNFFGDSPIRSSAVITPDRKLVFTSQQGTLYGFNLNTLTLGNPPDWQIALGDTAPTSIALDDQGYIYLGTGTGRLLKISLPVGQQAFILWSLQTGKQIIGSPVIDAGGSVYVGSKDSKLYAVDRQTGIVKWTLLTQAAIQSTPAISPSGVIFFGNDAGDVFAVDSLRRVQWIDNVGSPISAPLLYSNSIVFSGTLGGQIIGLVDSSSAVAASGAAPNISAYAQWAKRPQWSTFQGNNQRTGLSVSSGSTGVSGVATGSPFTYKLLQNYPNPFNPSTTLKYGLSTQSRVRLVIYNLLGQVVADLINTEQAAGWNQVVWNAKVSSGLYFYRLEAVSVADPSKRFVETKKMLLLR